MAIEYKRSIKFTRDSTIYGHTGLDEAGFPIGAGNGKLSQVLDMSEEQIMERLKTGISITNDPDNSLIYHLNIDGVSVATFEVPPDKFLKSVGFNESTKILSFVFVTESGTESTIPVNLSSLIDTYKAGNGLSLSSGYFSIKLKSGETRLVVSSDGLSFNASDIIEKIDTETQRATNAEIDLSNRMTSVETEFSNLSDDLEAKAVRAESAATNASNSATTATQQATVATEKASSANNSATRASTSEANASTYAGNAQASANTAKSYAEQAQTLLEEAELNVITSIEQTVTSTEPSGKNTVTITQKNGTVSTFDVYNGAQGEQGYSIVASVSRTAFTEANWTTYGTTGHVEGWSGTESIRNGCRIGDLFLVVGTATDTGNAHTLIYRSDTATGTLHGVCIGHSISLRGEQGSVDNIYTKSEVDSFLLGKAPISHTHTIANITNLQSTLDGKADSNHIHHMTFTEIGRYATTSNGTMTLNQSILNFDLIIIRCRTTWGYWYPATIMQSTLWSEHTTNTDRFLATTDSQYVELYFTSVTGLHIAGSNKNLIIVYGVSIGGSS